MSHHSQKLKIAISTIDRLTNELKALRLNKDQVDKAAQVPEVKVDEGISGSPEQQELPVSNTLSDSSDRDNTLLSELFFMSSPLPWQLEPIFFMQSPANRHEGAEVWEILP
ncbi:uncharacterized protein [Anabrus simplex]|uniref:uncharacterized protein n=1 Tax=Anabrus simplex TaxID=316456 RepID=UPI0034DD1C8E